MALAGQLSHCWIKREFEQMQRKVEAAELGTDL